MDRELLLSAIRSNPQEDMPRLLYADWLEELGAGDTDAATAEFIRVSCVMKSGGTTKVMPRKAYTWLQRNWTRLVPKTLALHIPYSEGEEVLIRGRPPVAVYSDLKIPIHKVKGRDVWIQIRIPYVDQPKRRNSAARIWTRNYTFILVFWRGFCTEFHSTTTFPDGPILSVLRVEQPLLQMSTDLDPVLACLCGVGDSS